MRLHLLKYRVPAVLLSAVALVLTLGASVAQAEAVSVPMSRGGALITYQPVTGAWFVASIAAIVTLAILGFVYAVVADRHRRQLAPAAYVGEPVHHLRQIEPDLRKAA